MGTTRRYVIAGAIVVGLVLALFGLFTNDADADRASILFSGSVAVMAGTLIYILATDDYQSRKEIFGAEAADRRSGRGESD
jgi:hypothetical protein